MKLSVPSKLHWLKARRRQSSIGMISQQIHRCLRALASPKEVTKARYAIPQRSAVDTTQIGNALAGNASPKAFVCESLTSAMAPTALAVRRAQTRAGAMESAHARRIVPTSVAVAKASALPVVEVVAVQGPLARKIAMDTRAMS